jgi:dienelactone hydrolase
LRLLRARSAWARGHERPFLLDNVRDLVATLDFLGKCADADASRVGVAGVSLGGMHAWLLAALDSRVAAAAPMIGVQSFGWALENEWYHGRVDSLHGAFDRICADLGKARK